MSNSILMMFTASRKREEVMFYDNIFQPSEQEQHQAIDHLSQVYHQESSEYLHKKPPFSTYAGLWAANTYISAQFLLYRKNSNDYLSALLPHFMYPKMLSADLSLRFFT